MTKKMNGGMKKMNGDVFDEIEDGIIELDSPFAKKLGFTSDKFDGWLWKKGEYIYISFIISKKSKTGNFKRLLRRIEELGFGIKIPTPLGVMQYIVRKYGFKKTTENFDVNNLSRIAYEFYRDNHSSSLGLLALYYMPRLSIREFRINEYELDNYAQLLAEKWVEEIGLHFSYYVIRSPPALWIGTRSLRASPGLKEKYILHYKWFSGDVSGIIGEVLYLAYLEKILGLRNILLFSILNFLIKF